ncbi:beta-mannosidase [Bifidobacterium sp. 64T4]|uniref:glycoside hydrolase family 26 protein n=1 Tax=Bifidobacterium pongonis TaxID=2834432 RepID=UPI001C56D09F|nr:glycosyl hydrolase [Bifidobacterium pongonis]MBW3095413.1 beta-mannosidase [Bifidobacterium pongonis]
MRGVNGAAGAAGAGAGDAGADAAGGAAGVNAASAAYFGTPVTVESAADPTPQPVDPQLNATTRALFTSLHQASGKLALFGHQNETSNVIGSGTDSDVHAVTGTYPALWGSDLSGVERDETTNIDGFSMCDVRDELLRAYNMGAMVTMSWHSANPITFGGYGHNMAPGSVAAVLPGGERHEQFLEWLDRVASFLDSVVDGESGESVPIVFRPFHEHTGDWFWWCTGSPARPTDTTPEQFIALWRMTVEYLRDVRGLHNVLYAYSPDRSRIDMSSNASREAGYLYAYPGDDYVDVLGFDDYWDIAPAEVAAEQPRERHDDLIDMLSLVGRLAKERGKIAAATEVGSPGEFACRYAMSDEDAAALEWGGGWGGAGTGLSAGVADAADGAAGAEATTGVAPDGASGNTPVATPADSPWTSYLLTAALANEDTRRVLWYMPWRNDPGAAGTGAYGTPVAGSRYAADFRRFAEHPFIRMANTVPPLYD